MSSFKFRKVVSRETSVVVPFEKIAASLAGRSDEEQAEFFTTFARHLIANCKGLAKAQFQMAGVRSYLNDDGRQLFALLCDDAITTDWQNEVRGKFLDAGVPPDRIDGGGCEGGPLDFTLTEVAQGVVWLVEQNSQLRSRVSELEERFQK